MSERAGVPTDLDTTRRVESLLYLEARLLDERRLDEWLQVFTDDAVYSLPIQVSDDPREPALIRDSRAGMEERVFRVTKTLAHAQNPPSRTQHDISNVEVFTAAEAGFLDVHCNQTVHEMRTGDVNHVGLAEPRQFAARCHYVVESTDVLRIARKTCLLINREYPIYNLTFIF